MALAGVSTNGIKLYYGVEGTSGQKPTSFTQLTRINNIAGISLDTEQIDASALEDTVSRYIAGRADTAGTWDVEVNLTDDTIAEWEALISAYQTAHSNNKSIWFEVVAPAIEDAFFVVAEPPQQIPMPEIGQNEVLTCTMTLSINEYKGLDAKVV